MTERMDSGYALRYWRERRHLSLVTLSARLSATEEYVSPKTLHRWERGESRWPLWAMPVLARILKVSEAELLHGPAEEDPQVPVQFSGAYTGLDLEIAEHVVTMSYTSWIASRPDDARRAILSVMPWLTAA